MIIMEPVQNAGGSIVPPGRLLARAARDLRPARDPARLRRGDLRLRPDRRAGSAPSASATSPDLITFAKGLTGAHFSMGGVLISDKVAEPFLDGKGDYLHGITFGGHPVGSAIALTAIEIMEREDVLDNVRANEPTRARAARGPQGHPDRRRRPRHGPLLRDRGRQGPGDAGAADRGPEAGWLLKDVLSDRLCERGMICRLDDRAEPIVQIAPPLVADAGALRGDHRDPPRRPHPRGRADGRAPRAPA